MPPRDVPPDVREALAPFADWLATLVLDAVAERMKGKEGPRYYDGKSAPMGQTAFLRLAGQGAFPSFKVGKKVRALASDVHAYIEAQNGARARPPRAPAVAPPVDVNDLSPAELHELSMNGALPRSRKGKRS